MLAWYERKENFNQIPGTPHICLWCWEWKSWEQPWVTDLAGEHEWFVEGAAWTEIAYVTDYHAWWYLQKNADTHKGDHHPLVFWINVQPNEGHQRAKSMQQNSPLLHESDELDWVSGARIVWMRRGQNGKKLAGCTEKNTRVCPSLTVLNSQSHY